MVGFKVDSQKLANELIKYFKEQGSDIAWINNDSYGLEVLIAETELERLNIRHTDVTIKMRERGFNIGWPGVYGDPHFTL